MLAVKKRVIFRAERSVRSAAHPWLDTRLPPWCGLAGVAPGQRQRLQESAHGARPQGQVLGRQRPAI